MSVTTSPTASIACRRLADAKTPVRHLELPGRGRRAGALRPRGDAGHPGAVPRDVPPFPADARLSRRDRREVESESDQPEGARAAGRACGRRAPTTAARATRSGRCSARSRATTPGLPGLRRDQSPSRANLQHVEPFTLKSGKTLRKVSPLAEWTTRDVWRYAKAHDIPLLPLYELGYSSIGCEPCTSLPARPVEPAIGPLAGPEARMRDPHRTGEVNDDLTQSSQGKTRNLVSSRASYCSAPTSISPSQRWATSVCIPT